jgi:hypothetical protein
MADCLTNCLSAGCVFICPESAAFFKYIPELDVPPEVKVFPETKIVHEEEVKHEKQLKHEGKLFHEINEVH